MSKLIRLSVIFVLLAQQLTFLAPGASAQGNSPDPLTSQNIVAFGRLLDSLGYFEELGAPIPFTAVSPSDQSALRLGGLFSEAFRTLDDKGWPDSLRDGNQAGTRHRIPFRAGWWPSRCFRRTED